MIRTQYEQSVEICRTQLSHLTYLAAPSDAAVPEPEYLFPEYARSLEPYFAQLGKEVRVLVHASKESWTELAVGNGTVERVFAVCLGYFVLALILAAYLNLFTVGNARTAGRAVRNVIRQQLLVIKVCPCVFLCSSKGY
jgi:E3 ubiquitin-protein ligase MARCH6